MEMIPPRPSAANDLGQSGDDLPAATRLLSMHPLLQGIAASLVAGLAEQMSPLLAAPGQVLFREGEQARHCLLVAAGRVEVMRFGLDGQERVHGLFESGQLVAEAAMFMPHGRYPMDARAQDAVRGWLLPRAALREACQSHPALAMRLLDWLGTRIYQRTNEVDWLVDSSAAQRLAAYLLSLRAGPDRRRVRIPIHQRQLAGKLGMRAETVSRLLSEWQQRGYVDGRQRDWELLDPEHLRAMSSGAQRAF